MRSQDRETLRLAEMLDIYELEDDEEKRFVIEESGVDIGCYKSKERTLEVLDEIQNILKPQMILSKVGKPIAETCDGLVYREPDEYDFKELSTYVYQMPEE